MKFFIKLSVFLAAAALVFTSFSAAFCADEKSETPVFYVKEVEVDVGEIYEEKDVTYDFIVENHGQGELHINRVKAG
ncbi:MAG TPA: hypothetical protein VKO43_04140 [Candidatus Krumholzibacteriaceae bacterium]|nr:hypothetical protein [Candidatus Krumholzibacteriaceae bacterium]